jgi:ribose 5-phosphate isomerase B
MRNARRTPTSKLRIVVGADDAGFAYKEALKADLQADNQVEFVVDVAETPDHSYPNVAIAAAEKIAAGKVELICAYERSHPRSTV